jgi:hypothetical protein
MLNCGARTAKSAICDRGSRLPDPVTALPALPTFLYFPLEIWEKPSTLTDAQIAGIA